MRPLANDAHRGDDQALGGVSTMRLLRLGFAGGRPRSAPALEADDRRPVEEILPVMLAVLLLAHG
jgi:hypothetical protein